MKTPLHSSFVLGYLGAGQLARMSAVQAFRFGIQVAVCSNRKEQEPVGLMTPHSFQCSFEDLDQLVQFARKCDLITLENEFLDSEILRQMVERSGTPLYPSAKSFAKIENKWIEKRSFEEAGIPVTPYALVRSESDLTGFGDKHSWPFLLKSSKGGYDGYGNIVVRNLAEAKKAYQKLGGEKGRDILAEAFVNFTHELAVQVARNETGTVVYPCCETIQEDQICVAVQAPAPVDPVIRKKAQELAVAATETIDGKGLFAFEFFLTNDGRLLLNESAPRPHNSGHYTIEACITSQFENHVRAVLGLPLGSSKMRKPAAVMINLLGTHNRPANVEGATAMMQQKDSHLHIYGKLESRVGRKMGHYTLLGESVDELYPKAKKLAQPIQI